MAIMSRDRIIRTQNCLACMVGRVERCNGSASEHGARVTVRTLSLVENALEFQRSFADCRGLLSCGFG